MSRHKSTIEEFLIRIDATTLDGCWIWNATLSNWGYGVHTLGPAHRVMWKLFHGDIPKGLQIDHECRVRACVNPAHLRLCCHKENLRNLGMRPNNKSGYRGVSWHKGARKWRSTITVDGRQIHLGFYSDAADAFDAYRVASHEFHGRFSSV